MRRNSKTVPYSVCKWLLPVVFCMQFVVSFCMKKFADIWGRTPGDYEYILLTQIFSIIIPCVLACIYSGTSFKKAAGIRLLKMNKAFYCALLGFCLQPVAILAGIPVQNIIGTGDGVISPPNSLGQLILSTLVVCIVPAFCEELFVRGILLNPIRSRGYAFSIFVTTVMFVILHGNIYSVAGYAILGIGAAFAVLNTNSVYAGVLVHLFFNFCGVVLDYTVNKFYTQGGFLGSYNFYVVLGIVGIVMSLVFAVRVYSSKIRKYQTVNVLMNLTEVFVNIPTALLMVMYVLYMVM